ncbi:nucleotide exchange factor GrpE [Candidatus Karelsulcia muelleri]
MSQTRKKSSLLKLLKYIEQNYKKNKEKITKLMLSFNKYKRIKIKKLIGIIADFENSKRRLESNKKLLLENYNKQLFLDLITIAEDFNRFFSDKTNKYTNILSKGINLINRKLWNLIKKEGIVKITTKIGDVFNTDIHEAISIQVVKDSEMKGKILHIIESGYKLKKQIIKYTKVIVGK